MHLRISIGSAIALGLSDKGLDCLPTTCYLMLGEQCLSNCGFCAQAREAKGGNRLSRILWPPVSPEEVADALPGEGVQRVCVQTLDYPDICDELVEMLGILGTDLPVSAALNPLPLQELSRLKDAGLERVGIGLDAASEAVFNRIKGTQAGGRHTWVETLKALENARQVFGKGKATTHIIVGMGETDKDVVTTMNNLAEKGIWTSLFAATPVKGAWKEISPPPIQRYRTLQAARELIVVKGFGGSEFNFDDRGKLTVLPKGWTEIIGENAFMTRGCPGCNRPYYNERPGGEMYNYPCSVSYTQREQAISQILEYGVRK